MSLLQIDPEVERELRRSCAVAGISFDGLMRNIRMVDNGLKWTKPTNLDRWAARARLPKWT